MWRKLLRALGCLSYLGMMMVIFGLVAYVTFSQFVRSGVTPAPDLYGLSEEEAAALLADQGLTFTWSEDEGRYDERVPAGHVLMQRPRAATLVKRDSDVTVILSRGPQRLPVPAVVGTALQAAQVTLAAAGLNVGRTMHVFSDELATGLVVTQQPAAGARVERAALVDLFLSLGNRRQTFVMPDLVDRSHDDVRRFFERRGFRLGRVSYETYADVAPGTVLRQFPRAGHALHHGDVISLGVVAPATLGAAAPTAPPPPAPAPSPENLQP